jgi:hypothetical protein
MGRLITAAKQLRAGVKNARQTLLSGQATMPQGCRKCQYHGQAAISREYDTGLSHGDIDIDRG